MNKRIVHVVGTGTIGEPLIGLLCDFIKPLGLDEVTFSKKQALLLDRSKVWALQKRHTLAVPGVSSKYVGNDRPVRLQPENVPVSRAAISFGREVTK